MARLTQKQVEEWIAQQGGPGAVQYSVEQKQIRNPSSDVTEQTLQPYVPIQVEVWRNSKTGATLSARRGEGGDFEVMEQTAADPNKPTAAQGTKEWRTEGTPDGQGGFDNSRPIMAAYVNGQRTGETRQPTGSELKDWNEAQQRSRNPGGKTDKEVADEAEAARQRQRQDEDDRIQRENAARAGRTEQANAETRAAAERRAAASEQRAGRNPVQRNPVTGELEEIQYDDKGAVTGVRIVSGQEGAQIEGPAPPRLTVGNVQSGLREYLVELNRMVAAKQISPAERTKRWAEAIQQSTAALAEQNLQETIRRTNVDAGQSVYAGGVNQRGQDVSMSNARLGAATTGFGQALDAAGQINRSLPADSPLAGQAFGAMLDLQRMNAERMGGMVTPGQVAPPTSLTTAAASPSPSPYAAVQAAQAAMAGIPSPNSTSELAQPGDPTLAGNAAQAAANPLFRPQPPVDLPPSASPAPAPASAPAPSVSAPAMAPPISAPSAPPAVQGSPSVLGDTGAPPSSGPIWSPAPPIQHPEVGTTPPINMDPSQGPVGQAPMQYGPGMASSMPIMAAAQQAMMPQGGPSWSSTNQMLARLGISPDILNQVRPMMGV